jgi:hypothetical protein
MGHGGHNAREAREERGGCRNCMLIILQMITSRNNIINDKKKESHSGKK